MTNREFHTNEFLNDAAVNSCKPTETKWTLLHERETLKFSKQPDCGVAGKNHVKW